MIETKDVFILGGGGREDALGWKLRQSPKVRNIYYAAPEDNAGTMRWGENTGINPTDIDEVEKFVRGKKIGLTVVGPEAPLFKGVVDRFQEQHLPESGMHIFGPTKEAAQIESSKANGVRLMEKYGIPYPNSVVFDKSQISKAHAFIEANPQFGVIKADGPALGKGVFLPDSPDEAHDVIQRLLDQEELGEAGTTVVIQERIEGSELSVIAVSDGEDYQILPASQDHKRLLDGDRGPNTGGMGAIAPVPWVTPDLNRKIIDWIIRPTIKGLSLEGRKFTGALYAGLMITPTGDPYVLEYNARFGDPETQALLPLMESDLFDLLSLDNQSISTVFRRNHYSVAVVLASKGYPDSALTGFPIRGLSNDVGTLRKPSEPLVFMSGVRRTEDPNERYITSGGRVLSVCAVGSSLWDTQDRAYKKIGENTDRINFFGMQYRNDIGERASRFNRH